MLLQSLSFKGAWEILTRALIRGGATVEFESTEFGIFTHKFLDSDSGLRFVVGGIVDSATVQAERYSDGAQSGRDELIEFVELHWRALAAGALLGLWVDGSTLHLDIVESYRLQGTAERIGSERGELAIYDAAGERSIYLCNGGVNV